MNNLSFVEQLRIMLKRQDRTGAWLAEQLGISQVNLYQQMKRDNFREKDMEAIAAVLGCEVEIILKECNPAQY